MDAMLVSHTHWDREWYRTFQAFRARLVDTVDRILELLDDDPGWKFTLDGQAVVLEDYLAIRPQGRQALTDACAAGRLAIGPWYVQPDSLLPSGESHVRNLLEGRRVASAFGPVSRVAYTPDSFGHPAQFPQLFKGFGLESFVYWRGNGSEIDQLGPVYAWIAPDGSAVTACHMGRGYFSASALPEDTEAAVKRLSRVGSELVDAGAPRLLLMNGADHAPPDANTGAVAEALAVSTGWQVRRGVLDDFVDQIHSSGEFHGALTGGRVANLLPGVWSSRMWLKLADRAAEAALVGWAEPWAALGFALGLADERPSIRLAWRELLVNQAHDSIGGCSADAVHDQMGARYATATELADQTTGRILERLAGLPTDRKVPWSDELELAVFNPSAHARSDLVRVSLDGFPTFRITDNSADIHPLGIASLLRAGFSVDGNAARVVVSEDPNRFRILPETPPWDLEFVANDIPAFGYRRVRLAPGPASPDEVDDGTDIEADDLAVTAAPDGTLTLRCGEQIWAGLGAIEDVADRGDTYDFDPVVGDDAVTAPVEVEVTRRRHQPTGIAELRIVRTFDLPTALDPDRQSRALATAPVQVVTTVRVAPGVGRVDLTVSVDNAVADHRMRLLFPTGSPVAMFSAATTFDIAERSTTPADDEGWVHGAPSTFPSQGWIAANGLTVAAPGLPEAEVTLGGTIAITLLRSVGRLAGMDLGSRPIPAGPGLATPGAQCRGPLTTHFSLLIGPPNGTGARDAELGLRAVAAGPDPLLFDDIPLVTVEGDGVMLSALKPAERGDGFVLRLLNPGPQPQVAVVRLNVYVRDATVVRLDEEPTSDPPLQFDDGRLELPVPPHAVRTLLLR